MRKVAKKNWLSRVTAMFMAVLLVFSALPSTVLVVKAETTEHPGYVTVTVKDENSNAISGATVTYTIEEKESGSNGFVTISSSGTTDSYGTLEVLDSMQWYDDLTITATVSKSGYVTDSTTISAADITSNTQDFVVVLEEVSLSQIEGIEVTTLDADYSGDAQNLVTVSASTEGVTIEYSTDGTVWSTSIPQETNAGIYSVYVRITKDGYETYLSGEKTANINKVDITGIDITEKIVNYEEGTSQELVTLTGSFEESDTVTWFVNDVDTGNTDIPKKLAVGNYSVKLVVDRGSNYNVYTKTVNAQILNAQLDLTGLTVTGLDSTYDGTAKEVVTVENAGDYTLSYQLDDGDQTVDPSAWTTTIPTVTNAGSYIVWVKATKENYDDEEVNVTPAEHAVAPYNVYVAKASQSFSFDNYSGTESSVELTQSEIENGKTFDFKATDSDNKANGTISYSVELGTGDEGIAGFGETDETKHILTVYGAGRIVIKATLSGNDNYDSCTIEYVLNVSGKSSQGAWISVPNSVIEYTLGNNAGIPANIATRKESKDKGAITYSIENSADLGLSINNSGSISVTDYSKLVTAIEGSNGLLNVTVTIDKAEYTKIGWGGTSKYPSDRISYTLKISMASAPASAYKIYSEIDTENELTVANGSNGWYNTVLVVKPIDGYTIIRSDQMLGNSPLFDTSVKFGETIGEDVFDQGAGVERCIYLKDTTTGEITKKIVLSVDKLDTVAPNNLSIVFPTVEEKDSVKYYRESIDVTFIAYDVTSSVDHFEWTYNKESGASASILDTDNGTVTAKLDTTDSSHNKYVGTLTLPKNQADQLRGNLQIKAVDKAGLESITYTDDGVFVIDTIAPTQTVEYKLKDNVGTTQVVGEKHYFSNEVEFTFKVIEANFYSNDVIIQVSKDGGEAVKQTVSWTTTDVTDEHVATITLSDDADYVVTMSYNDRSGKEMTSYTSEKIVVDKTLPIIKFDYKDYTDGTKPQSAIIKITEHNFRVEDILLEVIAKDIAGNTVSTNNLQQYLRTCEWTTVGDVHTVVIDTQLVDGIYELTFNYKDLALNSATEVKPSAFVVDRTAPKTAEMSIRYSNPITEITETILSTITFGFYNPNVTVTFTAHDSVSGIKEFSWSYLKETGASDSNVAEYVESTVAAVQDSTDKTKYTATVTLPKSVAEQIRGTVSFKATDNYNNTSNKLTDSNHVLVVDTIAPTMTVEYSVADNSFDNKDYYNKDLTASFTITEANFYKEDVKVKVKKNDGTAELVTPTWTDTSTDTHVGKVVIEAASNHSNDGDYIFTVEYKDRSNNEMNIYTSNPKVIDTTNPIIDVEYANTSPINELTDGENHQRKYFATTQTATITITEHNFNATDAKYTIVAKDVAGNELNASSLYTASSWTKTGDKNILTITYPGDANYTFDIEYTDLAKLKADTYDTDYFTVDTSKPTELKVTYSSSILDTVLNTITFGFYNAKATVTISATDNISGIHSMKYSYVKADGVSGVNAELIDAEIEASSISSSNGGAVGTATFEIPRSALAVDSQFNGTVNFSATDRAKNESDYLRDTKRIVVDNIAPTADIQYNAPVQTINGIAYYDGDISATVTVHEANFYSEDVQITVTKDGTATSVNANWTDNSTDVHVGTFTLSEDGDYTVGITYTDKSSNAMQAYTSEQMTIDTGIVEATITINGQEADGKAFKDEVVPAISFDDKNFESCEVKMYRTSLADKNVDVTDKFVTSHISLNETGGKGEFNTFDKIAENDGIYTITTELKDKAGHTVEKSITFTVNRFGSVYEYSDFLVSLISDGGAYVQSVDDDLVITEYNADRLLSDSLYIEILRDGKPLDSSIYSVTPEINETVAIGASGWYQYSYTVAKENFATDGVYKIAVSSKDATGNSPENNNYEDKNILFRVDSTVPEITSISGLEDSVINATEQTVKYTVYDTIGLASVVVYVDGKEVDNIVDFSADANNYSGEFVLKESTSSQQVRIVVTDKAGNVTDTDAEGFTSSYAFSNAVTVSTNIFVRWFANKALFYGSIVGGVALIGVVAGATVFFRKRKIEVTK
ncbi:MAG: Ig-like domain-containing protein [Lachnospira sp.]